jgi:hypothetical protein
MFFVTYEALLLQVCHHHQLDAGNSSSKSVLHHPHHHGQVTENITQATAAANPSFTTLTTMGR